MDENFVALLGTKGGPAIRPGSTNPSSNLLVLGGRKIVIDCGLGVTRGLVDQGMALKELSLVFVTHLHSDHYLELGPLIHTAWTAGLNSPVHVFAPAGMQYYWDHFLVSMKDDVDLRIADEGRPDLAGLVLFHQLDAGQVLESNGLRVVAMRNEHPPLTDTFALKFESEGHKVVFSGDTAYLPSLAGFARNADVLVHEAMLKDALEALTERIGNGDDRLMKHLLRSHTSAGDAGRVAKAANVKALALNHLIPSDDPAYTDQDWLKAVRPDWDGKLYIGKDGMQIKF